MTKSHKKLHLKFHGRIIDHLGIQMYQSPIAAVAELVANSWDADAKSVKIKLPNKLGDSATIVVKDNGIGMTFQDCEKRFLNIGYCRRDISATECSAGGRPILGRKGIGKFAGFGIAQSVEVSTISKKTGEKTVFQMNLDELRSEEYVTQGGDIDVIEYLKPKESRKSKHGTTITLKFLTLARRPSPELFRRGMARRFLLLQWTEKFVVTVNDKKIPDSENMS